MRTLSSPKLLLVWLLAAALTTGLLLARWDPAVPFDRLKVTSGRVERFDHHCAPADQYSPGVCSDTATFRSEDGRRLVLAFAELLPTFRYNDPAELRYSDDGKVWAVAQDGRVLASYSAVRGQTDVLTRIAQGFGLLGCLGVALAAGRRGALRLRAGPACPSPTCRAFDCSTLAGLLVATFGLARGELLLAFAGIFSAGLLFLLGIQLAARAGHIDADVLHEKLDSGAASTWIHRPGHWLAERTGLPMPPKERLTAPWRVIAGIGWGLFTLGFSSLLVAALSSLLNLVIWRVDGGEAGRFLPAMAVFGVVLIGLAGLLGLLLCWAANRARGGSWLGWAILGVPFVLVALAIG